MSQAVPKPRDRSLRIIYGAVEERGSWTGKRRLHTGDVVQAKPEDLQPIGKAVGREFGKHSQLMERRCPFSGRQLKIEVMRKVIGGRTGVTEAGKNGETVECQVFCCKYSVHAFGERSPEGRIGRV